MDYQDTQIPLVERWKMDAEAYKKAGTGLLVAVPQCEKCKFYKKGDAFHCEIYKSKEKPKHVKFCRKECSFFTSTLPLEIEITDKKEDRFYGGLFGFCIGDMLGVPVEFSSREDREEDPVWELRAYGTYHQPFGTWSDDTSLMLCLVDAINKGLSMERIKNNFISYYQKAYYTPYGEVFDIGNATRTAIEKMINGMRPNMCGGKNEEDNGNGSLMRILPIAFYGINMCNKDLIELIENISALTHAHDRSKLACVFYVEYAIQLLKGHAKVSAYDRTVDFIFNNCQKKYKNELKNFKKILNMECITCAREEISSSGYVLDTLEAALWVFFNADSYERTVLNAVNLGGDTDTIAAVAGGLAGIYYGYLRISEGWMQNVAKKEEMSDMFSTFYNVLKTEEPRKINF